MDRIIISTGDIPKKYTIIDTVMVFESGIIKGVEPNHAFELVKEHMRSIAVEKGGKRNHVLVVIFNLEYLVLLNFISFGLKPLNYMLMELLLELM